MNKKTCEASYYKFIGSVNCHPKWIRRRISVITSFDESAILETRVVLHAFKFLLKINRTWLAAQSVVDVEISILIGWICDSEMTAANLGFQESGPPGVMCLSLFWIHVVWSHLCVSWIMVHCIYMFVLLVNS